MTWSNKHSVTVWLSEEAADGIRRNVAGKVVSRPTIGSALKRVPSDPELYQDMRPDGIKDMDEALLTAGRYPVWDLDYIKRPLTVTLTPHVKQKLLAIAQHWAITNYRQANSYRSDMSRIAAVMEALGCGLLDFLYIPPEQTQPAPTEPAPTDIQPEPLPT